MGIVLALIAAVFIVVVIYRDKKKSTIEKKIKPITEELEKEEKGNLCAKCGHVLTRVAGYLVCGGCGSVQSSIIPEFDKYGKAQDVVEGSFQEWVDINVRFKTRDEEEKKLQQLIQNYKKPISLDNVFGDICKSINFLAKTRKLPEVDFEVLEARFDGVKDLGKRELKLRKEINEAYKLRHEDKKYIESLSLCYLHAKLVLNNPKREWKSYLGIKRLVLNLNYINFKAAIIGLLYEADEMIGAFDKEGKKYFESEIDRLFRGWNSEIADKQIYEQNCGLLAKKNGDENKHFILNSIINYLGKCYRYDRNYRDELVKRCEEDVLIYKPFLAKTNSLYGKGMNFEQAVRKKDYMCPSLPSFHELWFVYKNEKDSGGIERLKKIAKEIKYSAGVESEKQEEDDNVEENKVNKSEINEFDTEIIEAEKSGIKGKSCFMNSSQKPCTTEEYVVSYLKDNNYNVIRGEVKFWQAMFGLSFWEEIYYKTGGKPCSAHDISSGLAS